MTTAIAACTPDHTTPRNIDEADRRTASLAIWVRQPWMVRVGREDLLIRGTTPRDLTALALMHKRCTASSLLGRYHAGGLAPSAVAMERALRRTLAFVACTAQGEIVAMAVASPDIKHPLGSAEVGILVEDRLQKKGLGRELLTHLAGGAYVCGYGQLIAYTATDEPATHRLLTSVGRTYAVPEGRSTTHLHTYLPESAALGLGAVREHLAS